MLDEASQLHPLHPAAGQASLVPRVGFEQQRLLPLLASHGVRSTVSPLHFMGFNRELALFTGASVPMGLALDPMTHHRQRQPLRRSEAYRRQAFGNGAIFSPEQDPVSAEEASALVAQVLDAQRAHGATLLLTPYHLVGEHASRGRRLDLLLAGIAADHFRAERMDQPAVNAAVAVSRELYAAVALRRGVLSQPGEARQLADAYASLDIDGYWVMVEELGRRRAQEELRGAGELLGALAASGRPVVLSGASYLHLAAMVADISSSIGLGESSSFAMPDDRRPLEQSGGPRAHPAYHPALLTSFATGARIAPKAFATAPCRCGLHVPDRPPHGTVIDMHTAVVRAREGIEACTGDREERREWLLASVAHASHLAVEIGARPVPTDSVRSLLAGIDSGRGESERQAA